MATAKKKTTRKTDNVTALPAGEPIPKGFTKLDGGYAPSWDVSKMRSIQGKVTGGVREVERTIGRKKSTTRAMEVTNKKDGERYTVWESATLRDLFDTITETGEGPEVWIRFDGHGKAKRGQHPPKLFTVAIKQ